ncbi:MAG TPA: PQQ-binding-like beta-propeller repeat protein [Phycisphaerae bacterium]
MRRKFVQVMIGIVGLAALTSGCARPRGELAGIEQLQAAGYSKFWTTNLPLLQGDQVRTVALVDDNLYVTTRRGYVLAVQADVGMVRWAAKVAREVDDIFPPTHVQIPEGGGPTMVVTSTEVFVFDRYSGHELKHFKLEFPPGASAAGDAERLYIGSNNGSVYALIWNTPRSEAIQAWRVQVGAAVVAAPVFLGSDGLLIATRDGTAYACTAFQKVQLWRFSTDGPLVATPWTDESGAYIASSDRSLYHLHALDGALVWRCRLPQPLTEAPAVAGHTIYQYSHNDGIYAIDLDRGTIVWHEPAGRHFLAREGERVCLLTGDRHVQVLDAKTGRALHSIDVPEADFSASNTRDGAIFLVSADGRALCATPGNVPYIRREQAIAARQRLTTPPGSAAAASQPRDKKADVSDDTSDPLRSRLAR